MEYNLETRSKERFKSCWKIKKLVLDVETEWRPTLFHELYVCTNWTSFILLWFWEQEKRCIVPLYESIWMEEIERTGSITRWKELKSSATFCSHKSLDAETFVRAASFWELDWTLLHHLVNINRGSPPHREVRIVQKKGWLVTSSETFTTDHRPQIYVHHKMLWRPWNLGPEGSSSAALLR